MCHILKGRRKCSSADYELTFEYFSYTNENFVVKGHIGQPPRSDSGLESKLHLVAKPMLLTIKALKIPGSVELRVWWEVWSLLEVGGNVGCWTSRKDPVQPSAGATDGVPAWSSSFQNNVIGWWHHKGRGVFSSPLCSLGLPWTLLLF